MMLWWICGHLIQGNMICNHQYAFFINKCEIFKQNKTKKSCKYVPWLEESLFPGDVVNHIPVSDFITHHTPSCNTGAKGPLCVLNSFLLHHRHPKENHNYFSVRQPARYHHSKDKPQHLRVAHWSAVLLSCTKPNADNMQCCWARKGWQLQISVMMVISQTTIKLWMLTGPSGACFQPSTFITTVSAFMFHSISGFLLSNSMFLRSIKFFGEKKA